MCNKGIENEIHFIFDCFKLSATRDTFLKPFWDKTGKKTEDNKILILKQLISGDHIREFGSWLIKMIEHRKSLMYT